MKKIITREERDRKKTRNKIIIGLLLVFLMIISTAGYAFYNTEGIEKIKYNGIKFLLKDDGFWHFYIQNYEFATTYNPKQTEDISFVISFNLQDYFGKHLYFSHDSDVEAVRQVNMNIGRFASRIQLVCMEDCEEDLPIKDCSENVIIIRESSENLIKQEDRCIYILSRGGETIRAVDAFIFRVLEIQ